MLTITLRDLQWRARRFGLGVAAAGLVFATTLLLAGVRASFDYETRHLVDSIGADTWLVKSGVSGPFTANAPLSEQLLERARKADGVRVAEPIVIFRQVARRAGSSRVVNVLGTRMGGIVHLGVVAGRPLRGNGEALADERTGASVGQTVALGERRFRVVGLTGGLSYYAGTPVVALTLHDARKLTFDGQPLTSAIVTRGTPTGTIKGLKQLSPAAVRADLRKPVAAATTTVSILAVILTVVAAGIIGLMSYLTGLDRLTDFAVLKAVGVPTRKLLSGLVLQAVLLAVAAAAAAAAIAAAIAPMFPVVVRFTELGYAGLLVLAVLVGLATSLVNVRQATGVDPALAFGRG